MQMEWSFAFAVVLTGLAVVFLALVILILSVNLIGKFFTSMENKKNRGNNSPDAPKQETKSVAAPAPIVEDGIETEVVTVITAAIAAMTGGKGTVKSIKAAKKPTRGTAVGGRNPWHYAGVQENTRAF